MHETQSPKGCILKGNYSKEREKGEKMKMPTVHAYFNHFVE